MPVDLGKPEYGYLRRAGIGKAELRKGHNRTDLPSERSAKSGGFAVCTSQLGARSAKKRTKKFERCVRKVTTKFGGKA